MKVRVTIDLEVDETKLATLDEPDIADWGAAHFLDGDLWMNGTLVDGEVVSCEVPLG